SLCLFLNESRHLRVLLSFPTRRSSDLLDDLGSGCRFVAYGFPARLAFKRTHHRGREAIREQREWFRQMDSSHLPMPCSSVFAGRSEEHTSELQSPYELVCRLLLEKKKNATPCRPRSLSPRIRSNISTRPPTRRNSQRTAPAPAY